MMPEWLRRLADAVRKEAPKEFVGQLEFNVFQGGVSNINVKQSFKESPGK